jgi:hypothetical protein
LRGIQTFRQGHPQLVPIASWPGCIPSFGRSVNGFPRSNAPSLSGFNGIDVDGLGLDSRDCDYVCSTTDVPQIR